MTGLLLDEVLPGARFLSYFVGAGLIFAGVTNTCAMGLLLAKLPRNRRKSPLPDGCRRDESMLEPVAEDRAS